MKRIIGFLFTIILVACILIVYFNINEITNYTIKFFTKRNEIVIPKSNEYKRNYIFEKFSITNDYQPINKSDLENIYFNILNNGWNEFTFYCPDEYITCIDDIKSISNDNVLISKINNYVSPFNGFAYLDTTVSDLGEINFVVHKTYTEEEIISINSIIEEIIASLDLDKLSDTDKINKIKDYLIENITYDKDFIDNDKNNPSTKATGALIDKKAVCSGYSDSISLFLDKIGIPNIKISSENHIWNLVYIDNEWKHLDVTWSDTDSVVNLKNKFFLISTEELLSIDKKEHNFDNIFYMEAN